MSNAASNGGTNGIMTRDLMAETLCYRFDDVVCESIKFGHSIGSEIYATRTY